MTSQEVNTVRRGARRHADFLTYLAQAGGADVRLLNCSARTRRGLALLAKNRAAEAKIHLAIDRSG